ncbi:inositol monophosphatase family protein [Novosphingobium sp. M1R2S20]|uniref:Inositol monophosphatase family protein n=1 Tax=Novosphingobium rhizovicinum TaxID=3228928 RepID=A0ABV3R697_9SPHN
MSHDIAALLDGVRALVNDALPLLEARRYDITLKADGSPVTQADIFLEDKLTSWLAERLPGLVVIGEETFDGLATADGNNGWVAVLDPIDGTENFCSGLKEWGVSLSIWRGRQHAGSLLMLPELAEHMMTGRPIRRVRSRITGYSSSIVPEIIGGISEGGEARIFGCAVYNVFNVVRGALARFVNPKGACSWDLLAGLMLAREHGCDVSIDGVQFDGSFLEPDRRYRVDIRHRYDLHSG